MDKQKEETAYGREQDNRICHVTPEDAILRAQGRLKEVELFCSLGKKCWKGAGISPRLE